MKSAARTVYFGSPGEEKTDINKRVRDFMEKVSFGNALRICREEAVKGTPDKGIGLYRGSGGE